MKPSIALPIALASLIIAPELAPAEDAGADGGAPPKLDDPAAFMLSPPKDEKTPAPKPKEWADAPEIKLARGISSCKVRRVREWMKINCDAFRAIRADVVVGNGKDVYFFFKEGVDCTDGGDGEMLCSTLVDVVFPLRRGDRRAIQIAAGTGGYGGPGQFRYRASVFLSETWLDDDPGPIVTINSAN